ncbi:hypothetical protein ACN38_g10186 [Penicillium nordicum]|uniref:Uncharacterized protein n=1 Tax=Penicillium nordicum TaxID=229535 RepID=A0A0M8P2B8_9EURO|nr:hypothetical protein ACN38_g10186 [Penicillium nordicum]
MLPEGSNELGGEVTTNERVMCRMAYLVARIWGKWGNYGPDVIFFISLSSFYIDTQLLLLDNCKMSIEECQPNKDRTDSSAA